MNIRQLLIFSVLSAGQICAMAQRENSFVQRTMNLRQAVELELEHRPKRRCTRVRSSDTTPAVAT